jgi:predicted dehydrogenase
MNRVRWGILTCGKIARKFAEDLELVEGAELVAVASRDAERAKSFAQEFSVPKYFDTYEGLAACPEIDVIYVASPHSHHYEHTLLCLNHGKAVLCEKAFAINSRQAREMVELARSKNIFLMEALWTRFLPHYIKVREMLAEGSLGETKGIMAHFGFRPTHPIAPRLLDPSLGGGSLLDIGVYPIFFAQSLFGKPDEISARINRASTGVDEQCSMIFQYEDGRTATLFSTLASDLETDADIFGTEGRIRITGRMSEPSATIQYYSGGRQTAIPIAREFGWGYQYEARHVQECLREGLTESQIWSLDDTLNLMETLDRVRKAVGLVYSAD